MRDEGRNRIIQLRGWQLAEKVAVYLAAAVTVQKSENNPRRAVFFSPLQHDSHWLMWCSYSISWYAFLVAVEQFFSVINNNIPIYSFKQWKVLDGQTLQDTRSYITSSSSFFFYLVCFPVNGSPLPFPCCRKLLGLFWVIVWMCVGTWVSSGLLALTGREAHRHPLSGDLQSTLHSSEHQWPRVTAGFPTWEHRDAGCTYTGACHNKHS